MTSRSLILRTTSAAALAAALTLSGQALASASQCAVYSGGTVEWAGTTTNVNEFHVNYGQALVNNTATGITGNFWTTKGTGLNAHLATDTGGAQAATTAYYVYYGQYVNAGVTSYTTVVSTVSPFSEGYPTSNIAYSVGGVNVAGNQNLVFLGSYITDGNGDMVPFRRTGDEVILLFNTAHRPIGNTGVLFTNTSGGGTYPQVQSTNINSTGGVTPWNYPIPASISGVLINFSAALTGSGPLGAEMLDGLLTGTSGGSYYTTMEIVVGGGAPYLDTPSIQYMVRATLDGSNKLNFGMTTNPGAGNSMGIAPQYAGYVEVTHHLY